MGRIRQRLYESPIKPDQQINNSEHKKLLERGADDSLDLRSVQSSRGQDETVYEEGGEWEVVQTHAQVEQ